MSLLLLRTMLWAAVLLVLAAAAGIDLRRRIVPNESVMLVAAGGVAIGVLTRPGSTVLLSLLLCFVVLLMLLVFAHFNVLGAGDAKLIAAATLLVPPERIGLLLLAIALAGGLLSGAYLVAFQSLKHARAGRRHGAHLGLRHAAGSFARSSRAGVARMRSGYSVPYALAVLAGVAFYLASELYQCSSGISCLL